MARGIERKGSVMFVEVHEMSKTYTLPGIYKATLKDGSALIVGRGELRQVVEAGNFTIIDVTPEFVLSFIAGALTYVLFVRILRMRRDRERPTILGL